MNILSYKVPAIHCGHCTHTIKMELEEIEGVKIATADIDTKEVVIEFEPPATEEIIINTLREINYPPE